jgi:cell division protein FtsB
MNKKTKELLHWFFTKTDRGEENISNMTNHYELVERLQYRLEDMENEHMQLTREIARLQSRLDLMESELSNDN